MLFKKKRTVLKEKLLNENNVVQEKETNKRIRFRIVSYLFVFIILIIGGIFVYKYEMNKINNTSFVKEKPVEIPKKTVENPQVVYDPQKEMNDFFGKPVTIDNKGTTKIDLKCSFNIYERTAPIYINNYGNIGDSVYYTKNKIKNDKGEMVDKDVINLRYRNLNITNVKVNQKTNELEVIITTDKKKTNDNKTHYYEMEVVMNENLDKNIKKVIVIKDDLELFNNSIEIK